jgi:hypothetical protein
MIDIISLIFFFSPLSIFFPSPQFLPLYIHLFMFFYPLNYQYASVWQCFLRMVVGASLRKKNTQRNINLLINICPMIIATSLLVGLGKKELQEPIID